MLEGETGEKLEHISEGGGESTDSKISVEEQQKEPVTPDTADSEKDSKTDSKETPDYTQSEDSGTGNEEYQTTNELEEGRLINQNGKLTIEVEVKELGSSEGSSDAPTPAPASVDSNLTPLPAEDTGEFDSFRVYSEQNLPTPTAEIASGAASPVRRSSRSDASKTEAARINKAKQARGIYLRRMEHRNSQSNIHRTQSIEKGLDSMNSSTTGSPTRRYGGRSVSYNRRSGQKRLEKWSTTAASTGDLREAAWDYSNDSKFCL